MAPNAVNAVWAWELSACFLFNFQCVQSCRRIGIAMDVFSLHDEITQWQAEHDLRRLPTVEEHRELCNRITAYLEKGKIARVRAMKKAYEPDVDFVKVLKIGLFGDE